MFNKINGSQIKPNSITESHINGKLSEAKLNIDYSTPEKAQAILQQKIVLDSVLLTDPLTVAKDATKVDSVNIALDPSSSSSEKGVVLTELVELRRQATGEYVIDSTTDKVVYGKLSGTAGDYILTFVDKDEAPVNMPINGKINVTYFVRDDFWNVSERFTKKLGLLDSGVDVTTQQQLLQLVADIFGANYTLNKDGEFTHPFKDIDDRYKDASIFKVIYYLHSEIIAARGQEGSLNDHIQNLFDTLNADLQSMASNLSSNDVGKGAALIGTTAGSHWDKHSISNLEEAIFFLIGDLTKLQDKATELEQSSATPFSKFKKITTASHRRTMTFDITDLKTSDKINVYYNGIKQVFSEHYDIIIDKKTEDQPYTLVVIMEADMEGTDENPDIVEVEGIIF
jgi:hypothetical protein